MLLNTQSRLSQREMRVTTCMAKSTDLGIMKKWDFSIMESWDNTLECGFGLKMGKYTDIKKISKLTAEQALNALNTTTKGLSVEEVKRCQKAFGLNKLPEPKKESVIVGSLLRSINLLSGILLFASGDAAKEPGHLL